MIAENASEMIEPSLQSRTGLNNQNRKLNFYALQALNFARFHAMGLVKTSMLVLFLSFAVVQSKSFSRMPPLVYHAILAILLSTFLLSFYKFIHKDRQFLDLVMGERQRRKDRLVKALFLIIVSTLFSSILIHAVDDMNLFIGLFLLSSFIQFGLSSIKVSHRRSPGHALSEVLQRLIPRNAQSLSVSFLHVHILQILRVNFTGALILLGLVSLIAIYLIELSVQGVLDFEIWFLSLLAFLFPMFEVSENFYDKGFLQKTGSAWLRSYFIARIILHAALAAIMIICLGFYHYIRHEEENGFAYAATIPLGVLVCILASLMTTALRFWIPYSSLHRSLLFVLFSMFPPIFAIVPVVFRIKSRDPPLFKEGM